MSGNNAAGNSTETAKKLLAMQADLGALEEELKKLSREGDKIRNELRGLIDRVKIAKVKSYIDKTA